MLPRPIGCNHGRISTTALVIPQKEPTVTVDKSGNRVRQMFAEIAPKYDLMNHVLSLNVDRWWRSRTVRRLTDAQTLHPVSGASADALREGIAPAAGALASDAATPIDAFRVLDVCTGTGDLAIALWQRIQKDLDQRQPPSQHRPPQLDVIASDFCRPMLEIGVKKAQRLQCHSLQFVEADSMQLPFPENQFNLVTVAFGLRNVSQTDVGLSEMVRVCRPGGRVGILEFTMPRIWPLSSLYQFYFLKVLPRVGQWFAKNRSDAYSYLPESVGQFPQYEALAEMMKTAGLKDVQFFPMTVGLATLYVGTKA